MKEHKEDLIKIILSSVLLCVITVITKVLFKELPVFAQILLYAVPYLIVAWEVLQEAFEGIIHGEFFDESFLMCVATLGAFAIGEYPEAVFVMLFFLSAQIQTFS